MLKFLIAYWKEEDSASAVEYALFVAGIAMAIVFVVFDLGDALTNMMKTLAEAIASEGDA